MEDWFFAGLKNHSYDRYQSLLSYETVVVSNSEGKIEYISAKEVLASY